MAGYLEVVHKGQIVRYCLIPKKLPPEFEGKDYIPGLQIKASPHLSADGKAFLDPMRNPVPNVVPVREDEIWCPSPDLFTVTGWPCYPLNWEAFRKLPLEAVDQILNGLKTDWVSGQARGAFQLNWGGLTIAREYLMLELEVGAAIWPRRALPRWRNYYLMLAPASKSGVDASPFATAASDSVAVHSYAVDPSTQTFVRGDTAVVHSGTTAVIRIKDVPRLLALTRAEDDAPCHGVMPLLYSPDDGTFYRPEPGRAGRSRWLLSRLSLPTITARPDTAHLAVDFGTTNTAVAISLKEGGGGEVLKFNQAVLAKNLTESLDAAFWENARLGFFPMKVEPSNPMPTVLVEMDNRVQPFDGERAMPRRSIQPDIIIDPGARDLIRERHLKQEFKWQDDDEGTELRSAFLEILARLVGLQLRLTDHYQGLEKIRVVFTCPLSFSHRQTEQLALAVGRFKVVLEECGFSVSVRPGLVSESLANLYLISRQASGGGGHLHDERNVVVDIGGGTTDISVFAGTGEPLWLDSLNIGGKDLAEIVLLKRLVALRSDEERFTAVEKLLGPSPGGRLPLDSETGGKELQQLFLSKFGRGQHEMALAFAGPIDGVSAEFLSLLIFATGYGVQMAALEGAANGVEIPAARHIKVWFVGLGSRLFELAPLAAKTSDHLESARRALTSACSTLVESHVSVDFEWQPAGQAKLTVSKGALLVPESEPGLDLQTLFWADISNTTPAIMWNSRYDEARAGRCTHSERGSVTTAQLAKAATAATDAVVQLLGFAADSKRIDRLGIELRQGYQRGLASIASASPNAPHHPVTVAVSALKNEIVGTMRKK